MVAKNLLIGVFLCLLGTTALATTRSPRLGGPEFCNLQQLTASQPSQRLEFEGGSIDSWDANDVQFQCLGVAPARNTIRPNSLYLPSFKPFPTLVFVAKGQGIIGVHFPGCPETFDTGVLEQQQQQGMAGEGQQGQDSHQKVHRFRKGNIIAIPAGAVFWTYNDGNHDLVLIDINDVNNPANQLDMMPRTFLLAGGVSSQHIQGQQGRRSQGQHQQQQQQGDVNIDNIFAGFDTELLAQAFNSNPEIVRAMQQTRNRGIIVTVQQPMQFITPELGQFEIPHQREIRESRSGSSNGLEEKICSSKVVFRLDNDEEADIMSRQAGKLNLVNEDKFPILSYLDLAAETGYLEPNAMVSPHWSINSHTVVYVLTGSAHVQTVSNNGVAVFDGQVNRGDLFVVPQFFATTARAGENGFEWVALKTNRSPMKSPLAGYTSVFRAMPLGVIENAFDVSPSQAQNLKTNRGTESILLSPQRTSQMS